MIGVRGLFVFLLALVLSACASTGPRPGAGGYKVGSPYQIKGVWYTPREQPNYNEIGLASWYGPGFHGRSTANGEVYDQRSLTAAHTTLPMPVNVRVTNLANGRSIVLRVNDRGPFYSGRIIDVSERAAELLGFKERGMARVRVEYVGRADQNTDTMIASRPVPGKRPSSQAAPTRIAQASERAGGSAPSMAPIPNPAPSMSPVPDSMPSMAPVENPPERALASTDQDPPAASSLATAQIPVSSLSPRAHSRGRLYVQVGAFSNPSNAVALYNQVVGVGKAFVSPRDVGGRTLYRVWLGPVADADEASRLTVNLKARGHSGAQIVME